MPPKKPEPVAAAPAKKVRPTRSFPAPTPHIAEWKQTPALLATPTSSLLPFTDEAAAAIQGGAASDLFEDTQTIALPPALTSMTVHWCRPHELGTLDGSVPKIAETVRSTAGADDAGNIAANGVSFIAKACKAHVCPLDAFNASVMAALHALNDNSIRQHTPALWRSIYPQDVDGNPVVAPSGKYFVKVWCGSGWYLMEVDDRVPCDAEKVPLLPRSNDELEMWPHLLVKAALKTGVFGDSSGSSTSDLFSRLVCVLGGWTVVKHPGDLGVRRVLQDASSYPESSPPYVPVLVGSHPQSDALGRYSLYSHSVFVVQSTATNEQHELSVTARGAQMKWERPLAPAKVDVSGRALTDEEVEQELLALPKAPEYPDKRRTRQLLLLRDAPCSGTHTWTHSDINTRTTSALMCFPPGPAVFKHSAEWLEAAVNDLKPAAAAGARPSLGAHEARALLVTNSSNSPSRVVVEISAQASPLHVTLSSNAWATSVLAHVDAKAAAEARVAAAEAARDTAAAAVAEDADPQDTQAASDVPSTSEFFLPPDVDVPPPYSSDAAFVGACTFRCTDMTCFEITAAPGRSVYSISCACPDMALVLAAAAATPQTLSMGGFCIRFRSDAELQCATEADVYTSLGFTVQETYAQAAALDEWVDDHVMVAALKPGACVHALLQQLLLPSPGLAPFITTTRFHPPPSVVSNSVSGCAPALLRPSPDADAVSELTVIAHFAPPFELKPDAPPLPAILRVVAAPGDSVTLEAAAAGVWAEHTGTYADNFRLLLKRLVLESAATTDVSSCMLACVCCRCSLMHTTDTPDGNRSWNMKGTGAGALFVQSPLFVLQPGAPTVLTAYLADAPATGEGAAPVSWVLRIWSRTELQVRENTEPEDAITKLIASFEESGAGRSKEAEAARDAAIAASESLPDAAALAAEVADALALTDRKARMEALKKAASAMPSRIEQVNSDQGCSTVPVDAAQLQALQEAVALAVSENEVASKAAAENRENLKPQLAKWAADLDVRAAKTSAADIDKVVKGSFAQRNAFRQAAAVYASHVSFVEQALGQVKLGRNAPTEEGGEETVSTANLELVQELRAASQDGGDWPAAIAKLKTLGVWPKAPEPAPVDPKKKVSPEEQAKADKEFAEAKLLYDAAAEAPPITVLRSHVAAKLDDCISSTVSRLQGEIQEVEAAIKEDAQKRAEAAAAAAAAPAKKK